MISSKSLPRGAIPIDMDIVKSMNNKYPGFLNLIEYFHIKYIVSITKWREESLATQSGIDYKNYCDKAGIKFEPTIGSIFILTTFGGSFDFNDTNYGDIYILNGTIAHIDKFYPIKEIGEEYKRRVFGC